MVSQHSLYTSNNGLSKSLEKLSTGLRINRAQDDAAGLAMSEQMRTQIRGLGKAKQNAQDGMAALQIAEGALSEISNIMQRQRELAVQAANDTLTSTERKYLDDEFQELSKEIGRIALSTDYNGKNLLANGTYSSTGTSPNANNSFGVVNLSKAAASWTLQVGANYSSNFGGINGNQTPVTYFGINFHAAGGPGALTDPDDLRNFTLGKYAKTSKTGAADSDVRFSELSISGFKMGADGKPVTGANTKEIYKAIDALDGAVKSLSGTRAKIGTFINRLEYTVNNIANLEFNTQDAESRIRDTDFAKETTNFTKSQIIVQSATSMLAQANSLPQSVLGLLG